jgi:hypothetical protein
MEIVAALATSQARATVAPASERTPTRDEIPDVVVALKFAIAGVGAGKSVFSLPRVVFAVFVGAL